MKKHHHLRLFALKNEKKILFSEPEKQTMIKIKPSNPGRFLLLKLKLQRFWSQTFTLWN